MNSSTPRVRALVGLLALCLGVSVLAGCYTALRHPVSAEIPDDYGYGDRSCYDCHDEAAFYHSFYGVYFDYYYDSPWFGYYSDPWWYDSYWSGDDGRNTHKVTSDERHQWKRGAPSGGARGSAGLSGTAPYLREDYVKPAKSSKPPTQADKPAQKKASDKKRHTGGRGKKK